MKFNTRFCKVDRRKVKCYKAQSWVTLSRECTGISGTSKARMPQLLVVTGDATGDVAADVSKFAANLPFCSFFIKHNRRRVGVILKIVSLDPSAQASLTTTPEGCCRETDSMTGFDQAVGSMIVLAITGTFILPSNKA
ncbi:hypothetical protein Tco_1301068 [Tanacetum coccineum]